MQDSLIRNNLLYDNHASGISLYRVDAAEGARNDVVVNNTIRMAPEGRWAVNIKNRSTGNTVSNNVILHDGPRGATNIIPDSLSGFVSDHNAVTNRFSTNDGESFLTLAQWREATDQDGSSFASDPAALFAGANDHHLSAMSPAIDAGSPLGAPNVDLEGGGLRRPDLQDGALERLSGPFAGDREGRYHGAVKSGTHTFLPTERVHFGPGSLEKIGAEVRSRDRAFVVTGRSLHEKTDLVRRVEALLGAKHAGTFAAMGQHTPGSAVERAAREARGSDLLVSVGGGSVIDGTKAVARELGYPVQVAVPTTLSGAEWAHRVGITDEAEGRKGGFADPRAVPPVVVLDPEATLFTPQKLWLSTGIRALDHAVEGFLFGGDHPVTDVTGLEGARRLMEYLPRSKEEPDDVEVRLELQLAAWLSYFGPFNTPMGLSHALGRRIGASYEVPHGVTSCITLAPALDLVSDRMPEDRWRELEEALGGDPAGRISALVEALDLPSRLRDVGVPEEDLATIAGDFGDREEEALTILRDAY